MVDAAEELERRRPAAGAPGRRCGRAARRPRCRRGRGRSARPSGRAARGSRAPRPAPPIAQLARHAHGQRPEVAVENVQAGVGDRAGRSCTGASPGSTRARPPTRSSSRWGRRRSRARRRAAPSAPARSGGSASPPHSALRRRSPAQPASSSMRQVAGVACTRWRRSRRGAPCSSAASAAVSRVAIATRAAGDSGRKQLRPAMSKESVVTATSTSSAPKPGCALHREQEVGERRGAETCTPLGRPVEPEV